jgi:hypothetical protein
MCINLVVERGVTAMDLMEVNLPQALKLLKEIILCILPFGSSHTSSKVEEGR